MRPLLAFAILMLSAGCQRTPEQQQADTLRADAQRRGSVIENQAELEANQLEQQADALNNEANKTGGLTGERFNVRADALAKEARIVRKQADMQADAIKDAADARIKASESR